MTSTTRDHLDPHVCRSTFTLASTTYSMTLVYHGTPVLYPEHANGSGGSSCSYIAAIRFPTPVRLKSIRVTPEGVEHPTGVG